MFINESNKYNDKMKTLFDSNNINNILYGCKEVFNNNDNNNYNQQKQQSSNKKKVLILMSDTGGGHRASAQAIDQAIQYNYPNKIDVEIMDLWTEYAPFPYNRFVPYYRFMAKRPLLWRLLYTYGLFTPTKKWTEFRSACTCYSKFKTAIENVNPDFVISVHPLTQLMPISIVKELNKKRIYENKLKIPFITIVTDLGSAHPTWFDKRVDAIYVPSEAVKKLAIKYGISKNKILFKGLPIRTSFGKPGLSKVITRKNLDLNLNDKTVLLMGGGDGVGGIDKIASQVINQLKQLNFNSQLIIVCGHNKKIYDKLKETYQITDKHLKVIVKGFVNNIDEFMIASDCLITKAGPGTIAEGMIRGLPMIISSYLPGQVRITMYCTVCE
jgi:1,2-diacylglycerol 3-beta-galactosyltransferase